MMSRGREREKAALHLIESYWQSLRTLDTPIPARANVDPRGIENALEFAFLIHHIAPGIGRLRVAGAHLNDLSGMEVAGLPLSAMFVPGARDDLGAALSKVFSRPCLLRAELRSRGGFGRPDLRGDLLLLPLVSETGRVDRALGGLVSHGQIGRAPRRFDLVTLDTLPLPVQPAMREPALPARTRRFAEDPAPYLPQGAHKPHLRLVVSND